MKLFSELHETTRDVCCHLSYHVIVEIKESFTIEEIIEILQGLDIETFLDPDVDDDGKTMWMIQCTYGDLEFSCLLLRGSQTFEAMALMSFRSIDENPVEFVNLFNDDHILGSVHFKANESGLPLKDDDDEKFHMMAKYFLSFSGGVTRDHVELAIANWREDLFDFFEIEFEEGEELSALPAVHQQVKEMTIAEQIQWALGDSIKRSARELAEHLMLDKHVVNSNLYRYKDLFVQDGGQPPRWTIKS